MNLHKIIDSSNDEERSNIVFANYKNYVRACLSNEFFDHFIINTSIEEKQAIDSQTSNSVTLYRTVVTITPDENFFTSLGLENLRDSEVFKISCNISFTNKKSTLDFLERVIVDFITNHRITRTFQTTRPTISYNQAKDKLEKFISLNVDNDVYELIVKVNTEDEEQMDLANRVQEIAQKKFESTLTYSTSLQNYIKKIGRF